MDNELEDIKLAIESIRECVDGLNELKYKLLLRQSVLAKVMKANQKHTESTDNECIGDMQ